MAKIHNLSEREFIAKAMRNTDEINKKGGMPPPMKDAAEADSEANAKSGTYRHPDRPELLLVIGFINTAPFVVGAYNENMARFMADQGDRQTPMERVWDQFMGRAQA